MQSFTILFVVGLVAFASGQEVAKPKVCYKTTDDCAPVLEQTRGIFRNLRAIPSNPDPKVDIPKYMAELHDFFQVNLQTDCKVERCACGATGALECADARDNIRAILDEVNLPPCILESQAAASLLTKLRGNVKEGNKVKTIAGLRLLEKVINGVVTKGENEKMITCIGETVDAIREKIKARLDSVDIQQTCDFCSA